ncbi:MAG TPA: bifunctional YncE family protein/alkaline phosphatase family protein [bacterium]|nr:bifunctional YncE family protein/alkaline phosphatase family protein [bacterium]
MTRTLSVFVLAVLCAMLAAGVPAGDRVPGPHGSEGVTTTNWTLSPAGIQVAVGDRPLGAALSPDGRYLAVSNDGQGIQSLALVDTAARQVVQTIPYRTPKALYAGVAWAPDGRRLFASAGGNDLVRVYEMQTGRLTETGQIALAGRTYPAGLAVTPDGRTLLVVENLANRVQAVDLATGQVEASAQTGPLPYAVAMTPAGDKAYVSNWGDRTVTVLRVRGLEALATVAVGLHPEALTVDPVRPRLYVANTDDDSVSIVDTTSDRVAATVSLAPYPGAPEGSIPDGVAASPDGRRLFVANAGNNDVAVIDLASAPAAGAPPRITGLIPTAWYPTTVTVSRDGRTLFVTNAKGLGAGPNPRGPSPLPRQTPGHVQYIANMIVGTVSIVPAPEGTALAAMTARTVQNNGFDETRSRLVAGGPVPPVAIPRRVGSPSLIKHVIYVIKENRTYDQVLGDLPKGNGDPSLVLFGRDTTPNHHRLAQDFVLLDNFYADAEVSADGHNWAMAAIANDYVQKNWPANYSDRGRDFDFQGGQPAAYPRSGFLWDGAARAGVSYRVYGEFTEFGMVPSRGTMPSLSGHVAPGFRGYDLTVPDQTRIDEWLKEFREFEQQGTLPQLMILWLPRDHTAGTRPGAPTPQAMVADNDLALGRLVETVSHSRYAGDTVIVATEDDAQNGPDHVDAHRTIAVLAGAFVRRGTVDHTLYSTVSLLRTIELILGIPPLTQFDAAAQPLLGAFTDRAAPFTYTASTPRQSLVALNAPTAPGAAESLRLPLNEVDEVPPAVLNRILWRAIKGDVPMPAAPAIRR